MEKLVKEKLFVPTNDCRCNDWTKFYDQVKYKINRRFDTITETHKISCALHNSKIAERKVIHYVPTDKDDEVY